MYAAASGATIDYQLRYSNDSAVPGRRPESASDLGDLTAATNVRMRTGRVNATSNETSLFGHAYYRFTLTETSTIRIELRNLTQNADLYLRDRIGNTITYSNRSGISNEYIVRTLDAGTYHIQVYAAADSATVDYRLRYSNDSVVPGRRLESAIDLGNLTAATNVRTRTGQVNETSNTTSLFGHSYYRFTLTGTRTIQIELRNLTQDADLILRDRIGNTITYSNRSGISDESIVYTLNAGTYLIHVDAEAGGTTIDYQLRYHSGTATSSRAERSATTPSVSQPLWHDDAVATATTLQSEERRLLESSGGALAA